MEMKMGRTLAELRRARGMTQEQLAAKLGITAPAISKWETDSSYPDITLLCPLARALGTNVDTLLQFEESLSDEAVVEHMNATVEAARRSGCAAAEEMLLGLLHKYPSSIVLKFNAALVWDVLLMLFPTVDEQTRRRWTASKEALLTEVRSSGTGAYWQIATLQLAGIAIAKDELDPAEQLLKELPDYIVDPTISRVHLHLKKGEPEQALKAVQRRLFSLTRQVQACLTELLNPALTADNEQALELCRIYQTVDELFGCTGLYDGLFLEVYLRMDQLDAATDCFERYVDALTGDSVVPRSLLFSPGLNIGEARPASSRELRQMLLRGLEDEQYQKLLKLPKSQAAIKKLRASVAL